MTDFAGQILNAFSTMSVAQAAFWLFMQNLLQFALCLFAGHLCIKWFEKHRIGESPEPLEKRELALAFSCVLLNSVVALTGWYLWRRGIIVIHNDISVFTIIDVIVLLLMMDFLMYVTHRICHHKLFFSWVHGTHHLYSRPRPLSLFVLNPLEVFGFGALWLVVLSIYHSSWAAIVVYLLLNAAWGTIGHIGVEPMPKFWPKIPLLGRLSTSTFHSQHHRLEDKNFGFYTDVWDRLFGTVHPPYRDSLD